MQPKKRLENLQGRHYAKTAHAQLTAISISCSLYEIAVSRTDLLKYSIQSVSLLFLLHGNSTKYFVSINLVFGLDKKVCP